MLLNWVIEVSLLSTRLHNNDMITDVNYFND